MTDMALVQEPLSQAGVMKTVLVDLPLVIKKLYYKLSLSNLCLIEERIQIDAFRYCNMPTP